MAFNISEGKKQLKQLEAMRKEIEDNQAFDTADYKMITGVIDTLSQTVNDPRHAKIQKLLDERTKTLDKYWPVLTQIPPLKDFFVNKQIEFFDAIDEARKKVALTS